MSTLWSFCKQGFLHVVPEGLDHILFVLGIFFLGREWRPLLLQVSTFTLAHSVTLALVTLGFVSAPSRVVEPLIAASIVLVAGENIWRARYSHSRLAVVFLFGLVHGMGFASALGDLSIPSGSVVAALAGFNLGVEGGQLAVIFVAMSVSVFFRGPELFRRWVAVPGSAFVGMVGLYWTFERIVR